MCVWCLRFTYKSHAESVLITQNHITYTSTIYDPLVIHFITAYASLMHYPASLLHHPMYPSHNNQDKLASFWSQPWAIHASVTNFSILNCSELYTQHGKGRWSKNMARGGGPRTFFQHRMVYFGYLSKILVKQCNSCCYHNFQCERKTSGWEVTYKEKSTLVSLVRTKQVQKTGICLTGEAEQLRAESGLSSRVTWHDPMATSSFSRHVAYVSCQVLGFLDLQHGVVTDVDLCGRNVLLCSIVSAATAT